MGQDGDKDEDAKPASRFARGAGRPPKRNPVPTTQREGAGPRAAGLARPPRREPEPGSDRPPPPGDRPPFRESGDRPPPRGDRPPFGDRGDRPPQRGDRPPFGDRGDRPPQRGDRPPFGDRGDRPPPRGDRPPFGDRGDRPPPRGDRPGFRDRGDRPPPRGDRPPFEDRGDQSSGFRGPPSRPAQPWSEPRTAIPPDLVTGAHAVESLVQFKPSRVKDVYLWSGDPGLKARITALAQAKRLPLHLEAPPGIDPASPNPQGVAVRVTNYEYTDLDQLVPVQGARPGTLVVVLDSITDPRNLGAIVRSAAFFGATAVVLPQDRAAEMTPLVERIAEGGSASVPVVRVVNLARTLKMLHDRGVEIVGTALDGTTGDIRDHAFGTATALVLGAEGVGIRPLVRKGCDVLLTLQGAEAMPSLNVAAFATLALAMARGSQRG